MGKSRAYFVPVEPLNEPVEITSSRSDTGRRYQSTAGPEMLSIVRLGTGAAEWIVVSLSADRRIASIAPLNNNGSFGMRHGVPVSALWPYYGSSEQSSEFGADGRRDHSGERRRDKSA